MKQNRVTPILFSLCLTLAVAGAAAAQDVAPDEAVAIDDVVVTARRAGAPMWEISRGDSTVILVGSISGVPRDFAWRPEALEAATARSQRILSPTEGRASVSDLLRLLWRIRTVGVLPSGTTTADHLSPEQQARLEAVMADKRGESWRIQGFVPLSFDLLEDAGYERRSGRGAVEAVRRAAREAGLPMTPRTYLSCVEASIAAAEAGPVGAAARLEAWRSLKVAAVLATPLDQALNLCWPSGDPEIAPVLRTQWAEATQTALGQPGVTMGVASLRILAEPGGVLDQLEAQGLDVVGPPWKAEPGAPQ